VQLYPEPINLTNDIVLGADRLVLIAGPCVVESYDTCAVVAEVVKSFCEKLSIHYVFKASYDKANRTSGKSFRSLGIEKSLGILEKIKKEFSIPLITDVHETVQVGKVAEVVDILQIPAFLCRQTDLLETCGKTQKPINIKRGQFMAPEDMKYAVEKVNSTGNPNTCLTERGASFGYHNLVVDLRSIPVMRQFCPVIFDVTHSVQQPGGAGGSSGGQREFAPYLARAAASVGVDGFFIETHPNPAQALSDGPNMIPLAELETFVSTIKEFWDLHKSII